MDLSRALLVVGGFFKICLLQPFALQNHSKGRIHPEISSLGNFHVVAVISLYLVYHNYILAQTPLNSGDGFSYVLNLYGRYAVLVVGTLLTVVRLLNQKAVMEVVRIVQRVDSDFLDVIGRKMDTRAWLNGTFFYSVFGVYAIACFEQANCITYVRNGPTLKVGNCMLICCLPYLYVFLAEMQYISYLTLLKGQFRELRVENERIALLTKQEKLSKLELFQYPKLRQMYDDLKKASSLTNSAFSVQNMFVTGSQFILVINLTYDLCFYFTKDWDHIVANTRDIIGCFIWDLLFIFFLAMKCYANQLLANESNITETISELFFAPDLKLQTQYKSFFMESCYFQFDSVDPMSYNMQFFLAILVTCASYIMVLIQFDASSLARD